MPKRHKGRGKRGGGKGAIRTTMNNPMRAMRHGGRKRGR